MQTISNRPSAAAWRLPYLALAFAVLTALALPNLTTEAHESTALTAAASAPPLSTAQLAPADAIAYAALTLDPDSAQWQQASTLLARMGGSPLLQQAAAALAGLTGAGVDQSSSSLNLLISVLAGEVGIVFTIDPTAIAPTAVDVAAAAISGNRPVAAVLQQDLPRIFQVALILRPARPMVTEAVLGALVTFGGGASGTPVTVTDYQGVRINSISLVASSFSLALARVGDFVVIGASVDAIKPVIDTATGHRPALATSAAFQRLREELPGDFLSFTFTSGPAVRSSLTTAIDLVLGAQSPTAIAVENNLSALDWSVANVVAATGSAFRFSSVALPGDVQTGAPSTNGQLSNRPIAFTSTTAAGLAQVLAGISDMLSLDLPGMGKVAVNLVTAPGATGQQEVILRLALGWLTADLAVGTTSGPVTVAPPANPLAAAVLDALPPGYDAAVVVDLQGAASAAQTSITDISPALAGVSAIAFGWSERDGIGRIDGLLYIGEPAASHG